VRVAKAQGQWVDPAASKTTVAELATRLLDTKCDRNTRAWYVAMVAHVNRRWAHTPVAAVTHVNVQTWIVDLTRQVGQPTVRGAFIALHEILKIAIRSRFIVHDPCFGVRLPPRRNQERLFLTASEVTVLADTIEIRWPGYGWGLLVRFAAYSGCRAGEIGGLTVKYLDLPRKQVRIAVARKSYGADGDTKTHRSRWVVIPTQLCDEIAVHLAARRCGLEDRVWTGERGGPVNHHWFYERRFKPVVEELSEQGLLPTLKVEQNDGDIQVETLRFHDLRHTCVAFLIGQGNQQYQIMQHLGHTTVQTTINMYGHLFPSVHDDIRTALERTWGQGQPTR
jgi:integrase